MLKEKNFDCQSLRASKVVNVVKIEVPNATCAPEPEVACCRLKNSLLRLSWIQKGCV
jgi:hypothetical protein